uniref:Myb-like domain-containing protein n=1 Tax=Fagus sylvatica TaxID=28930 RepID=A0A2N9IHP4_FAGSY
MDSLFCKSECNVSQVALPQLLRAHWTPEEDAIFQATFKENGGIQCQGVFELIAAKLTTKTLFQIKAHFGQNVNTAKLLGRTEQYPIRVPLDESEFNDTSSNGESKSGDRAVDHQKPAMSAKGQRSFQTVLGVIGKGQPTAMSRKLVPTRTAEQITSYSQKHFKKQAQSTSHLTSKVVPKDGTPIYQGKQVSISCTGSTSCSQNTVEFSTSIERERDEAIRKVQLLERTLEEERAERKAEREAAERKAERETAERKAHRGAKRAQREAKHKAHEQYIVENYGNQP